MSFKNKAYKAFIYFLAYFCAFLSSVGIGFSTGAVVEAILSLIALIIGKQDIFLKNFFVLLLIFSVVFTLVFFTYLVIDANKKEGKTKKENKQN